MTDQSKQADESQLSKDEARKLIKAIEDVEREEADEEERIRNERKAG